MTAARGSSSPRRLWSRSTSQSVAAGRGETGVAASVIAIGNDATSAASSWTQMLRLCDDKRRSWRIPDPDFDVQNLSGIGKIAH